MDVEGEKERTLQTDGHVYEIEQGRVCVCVCGKSGHYRHWRSCI